MSVRRLAVTTIEQEIWCQRRDSNSQTPVSKTGCYSNSHTLALWCTGEDLNLRVPLGETGLQPVRFGRAHAPVHLAEGRRIGRPSLLTMPRFSGPVAGHSAVPSAWRRVRELNPLASCESPCLADKCLTVRPTLRQNCQRTKKFW